MATKTTKVELATHPIVGGAYVPEGEFGPKPNTKEQKRKQSQKDFIHAHIGPERISQIDCIGRVTGYNRTELVRMAWDSFIARPDVSRYLQNG